LKIVCWKHRDDWKQVIANSKEWLSSEINNVELEDKLYEACEKFIIDRFQIKNFEDEQKNTLVSGINLFFFPFLFILLKNCLFYGLFYIDVF
jgi:hypothetical protein